MNIITLNHKEKVFTIKEQLSKKQRKERKREGRKKEIKKKKKEGRKERRKGGRKGERKEDAMLSWHFPFQLSLHKVNENLISAFTDQEGSGVDHCRHLKLISSESANI